MFNFLHKKERTIFFGFYWIYSIDHKTEQNKPLTLTCMLFLFYFFFTYVMCFKSQQIVIQPKRTQTFLVLSFFSFYFFSLPIYVSKVI